MKYEDKIESLLGELVSAESDKYLVGKGTEGPLPIDSNEDTIKSQYQEKYSVFILLRQVVLIVLK